MSCSSPIVNNNSNKRKLPFLELVLNDDETAQPPRKMARRQSDAGSDYSTCSTCLHGLDYDSGSDYDADDETGSTADSSDDGDDGSETDSGDDDVCKDFGAESEDFDGSDDSNDSDFSSVSRSSFSSFSSSGSSSDGSDSDNDPPIGANPLAPMIPFRGDDGIVMVVDNVTLRTRRRVPQDDQTGRGARRWYRERVRMEKERVRRERK